ncbi:NAD(P)-dependent alcohol dehydrogenase [Chondromyces crocatus]|uniref:Alcohol dehydrogenase n=1 Tax=Chondromyces crocatus TaxID=52 RepID=A0A0K1EJF5_CHOCO|nr:NAD(P)-dependent alcohol dehydrogenase [Chondromyces crocatus]AKT40807.1 alcohol dehydrogenase [Chondromyces crocatus]
MDTYGYAAHSADTPLAPFHFKRRSLRPDDVAVEILYCGVCHTDLHMARNDWGVSQYPLVPGHEIVGRVVDAGVNVSRHRAGDIVAIGTFVDSCGTCAPCQRGDETMCKKGVLLTYNGLDPSSGEMTRGGYSKHIVARDRNVLQVPKALDPSRTGPLLCAGTTMYTPLEVWNTGPGMRVAIAGLGGLGHLGVKFAAALGAEVTVITRSAAKAEEASALGAHHTLVSTDAAAMARHESAFDLIVDTIPVAHDLRAYVTLLDHDGTLVNVGAISMPVEVDMLPLVVGRRRIAGAGAGGNRPTQEMLAFCAEKNVLPETELIGMESIAEAFDRLERGDVRYRFVLDVGAFKLP